MEVDGTVVSPEQFAHGVSVAAEAGHRVNARRAAMGEPSYTITPFDLLTVAAMVVFAEARIDVAVLEVGLGGRWDATSATDPVAVAITGIGLDHTRILGDTLAQIAGEKAAVIKPGRFVVLGEGTHEPSVQRVIEDRCAACGVSPWIAAHEVLREPDRIGGAVSFCTTTARAEYRAEMHKPAYQPQNAACAIALAEGYVGRALDAAVLEQSLDACPIPGRFDVVRADPLVLVDACHNPQSCENFVAALDEAEPDVCRRPALLIAALSDKDVSGIVDVLVPAFPRVMVTATQSDRALPVLELAKMVREKLRLLGRDEEDALEGVRQRFRCARLVHRERCSRHRRGHDHLGGRGRRFAARIGCRKGLAAARCACARPCGPLRCQSHCCSACTMPVESYCPGKVAGRLRLGVVPPVYCSIL